MTKFAKALKCVAGIAMAMIVLSGCAINMPVPIKDPAVSTVAYNTSNAPAPLVLSFRDDQSAVNKAHTMTGGIPMKLLYQDKPFEAAPWVATQTVKEMAARGLPVTLDTGGSAANVLIKRIHIINYRASGFSPFVTFTSLIADVQTPHGIEHVTAYVKRGKVPVWSFDEVIDPTFNDSLSILTKELAAKLNQAFFNQIVSDEQINALIAKIEQDNGAHDNSYLDVYQLGFGNNPIAIPELVKLSTHKSEYVRLAALSSLGILKAKDQMSFLITRYESTSAIWQDRAMALKAIGDLGTPESRTYLAAQSSKFADGVDKEARWTKDVIALYLRKDEFAVTASAAPPVTAQPVQSQPAQVVWTPAEKPTPAAKTSVNQIISMPAKPTATPVTQVTATAPTVVAPAPVAYVAPAPAPARIEAVAPAAAVVPAAVNLSAPTSATFKVGVSSTTVERLARQYGCDTDIGAGLVSDPGPVEMYREQCRNGQVFQARCEMRQCSPLE